MVNKVRKEMQTPLMQLKLKMIQDNVERWDSLWASYEGHYQEMTDVETRVFYA